MGVEVFEKGPPTTPAFLFVGEEEEKLVPFFAALLLRVATRASEPLVPPPSESWRLRPGRPREEGELGSATTTMLLTFARVSRPSLASACWPLSLPLPLPFPFTAIGIFESRVERVRPPLRVDRRVPASCPVVFKGVERGERVRERCGGGAMVGADE